MHSDHRDGAYSSLNKQAQSPQARIAPVAAHEDTSMDELTIQVNAALDRVKADNAFNDDQLATHLGTNRMALWRWRHGNYSKAFRTIIPITVLANTELPPGWTAQAADIRILAPLLKLPDIAP